MGIFGDNTPLTVREEIVLDKYDGDLTPEQMEKADPAETITIVNDELIRHERRGTVLFDKEQGIDTRPAKLRNQPYSVDHSPEDEGPKKEKK